MMYDSSMRLKKEKEARHLQEQLAFDMKILEQLLEESQNEAMEQATRKVGGPRCCWRQSDFNLVLSCKYRT